MKISRVLCSSEADLAQLINEVHDACFDLDNLQFDVGTRTLRLNIFCNARAKSKLATLEVRHVVTYEVTDTEGIGLYDINTIEFERMTMSLRLIGQIPYDLSIRVSKLELELLPTDVG